MRILKAPKVYLIARPQIVKEGLAQFLEDQKLDWPTPTDGVTAAEQLVEAAGRCCYMSFGKKAGSKTNWRYIQNLLGRNPDGSWKPGPAHGSVTEHPCWSFLVVGAGRGFCYDSETEVLTEEGWKRWPDITGQESFATLNLATDELEYQRATAITQERWDGPMYQLKSKMVDLLVTPNHRMLHFPYDVRKNKAWRIGPAVDILGKRVKYKRNAQWIGSDPEHFEIPSVVSTQSVSNKYGANYSERKHLCPGCSLPAKAFATFLGYWLAEGHLDHCEGGGYFLVLSQNDDSPHLPAMRACIEAMGLTYSIGRTGRSNCLRLRVNGGRAFYEYLKPYSTALGKRVPPECKKWSPSLLRCIIEAHLAGDGSFPIRSMGEANTVSKALADDLQELALKCGISATIRTVNRRSEIRYWRGARMKNNHVGYVVSYCAKRNTPLVNHNGKRHDSLVDYNGMVYCVSVPNGLLYVRRNGRPVWSGNSHEQVRHRTGWAYSQLSTRYCDFEREEEEGTWEPGFCIPTLALLSPDTAATFAARLQHSQQFYVEVLHQIEEDLRANSAFMESLQKYDEKERSRMMRKAARGAARDLLPIATEAIMVMSANARALWNCIVLRANEHAEAVIREVYVQIAKIMEKEMPALFNGLKYETCWDGTEAVVMPRDKL